MVSKNSVATSAALAVGLALGFGGAVRAADTKDSPKLPQALFKYVAKPTPQFQWTLRGTIKTELGTVYDLDLVSQKWQGIVWKHVLHVYEPKTVKHGKHVLLFVTGGSIGNRPGRGSIATGLKLAALCRARVAMLYQVPNQPLLGGRKEDDLITETWLRYLKTGDENWPLLFPMVNSAVKAMDAVEQLAKKEWKQPVEGFVVTGASKRGWTSWLTAAADKRIVATAPIVINVLNFRPQMKHQIDTWGKYSEQIKDYTSKGLVKSITQEETPRDVKLRRMMDPYTYRKRLTMPKLLIHGTNDRYWVVDAMNIYWDGLVGPKYVLQVPNAGHSLKGGRDGAFATLAAFFQQVVTKSALPRVTWKHGDAGGQLQLTMQARSDPKSARLWVAHSPTKDFRNARWKSKPVTLKEGRFTVRVPRPKQGHVAVFGEIQFEFAGVKYSLSSQIRRE
ncbi:MAG: PhoPQ-activated pathogenicity-related family protein [Planctomycetaceae bacterium]